MVNLESSTNFARNPLHNHFGSAWESSSAATSTLGSRKAATESLFRAGQKSLVSEVGTGVPSC